MIQHQVAVEVRANIEIQIIGKRFGDTEHAFAAGRRGDIITAGNRVPGTILDFLLQRIKKGPFPCDTRKPSTEVRDHLPLDLVIILLGTNDTKSYFRRAPCEIAKGHGQACGIGSDLGRWHRHALSSSETSDHFASAARADA